jgi:TonB family protein
MHRLEQEALNDPFLAEALEGYDKAGADQQDNLDDIQARLKKRINENNRRVVLWRSISIAASVIIFLTIGGLWLNNQKAAIQPKLIAQVDKIKPAPPVIKSSPADNIAQQTTKSTPLVKNPVISVSKNKNEKASRLAKVVLTSAVDTKRERKELGYSTATITADSNIITGIVTANDDGQPLPGASIKVKGTNIVTSSDANGKFSLKNIPANSVVDLSYIGYENTEVKLNNKDSLRIAMKLNNSALAEVVVIGYGTQKKKDLTGSISSINAATVSSKPLDQAANTDITTGIQGKVSGLQVDLSKSRTISGTVTAKDDGTPMPGVTVKIKGTNIATQTNSAGKYTLSAVPDNAVLEFRSIGYSPVELRVHNSDKLAVAMTTARNELGEVVVTSALGIKSQSRSLGYATATISGYSKNMVKGIVTGNDDDEPMAGVIVRVKGTNKSTLTDAEGKFSLTVLGKSVLQFSFVGYLSKEVQVHQKDSITVSMTPNIGSLAEVANAGSAQYSQSAHPNQGWSIYRKYLKENALSPDGKTGVVRLSFTVNSDNSLSNLTILKSVSAKTDSAAIALVKNGPGWVINTDNKPEKVKLRIRFKVK